MNTETTTAATITAPAATLRAILAALNEYTTRDKHRHTLTLADVRPVIIEQTAGDETRPTALRWQATNSYELLTITQQVEHTLSASTLIDPAQLLAAMPKKTDARKAGPSVLTLTGNTWQLTTGNTTNTGTTPHAGNTWPNTAQLHANMSSNLTPVTYGSTHLATLTKAAAHLTTTDGTALTLATMNHNNGQPNPNGPTLWIIDTTDHHAGTLTANALHMPQRRPK